jgi:hypothetical protein
MAKINFPEFNGAQILSIFPEYKKVPYTSGVDVRTGDFRSSSYQQKLWNIVVANRSNAVSHVILEFTQVDGIGVTQAKPALGFYDLEPGEKMRNVLAPTGNKKDKLLLKRMVVNQQSIELNYTLGTVGEDNTKTIRTIVGVVVMMILILFVLKKLHYETYNYYPQITVVKETDIYSAPMKDKLRHLKPGAFLRIVAMRNGPEQTIDGVKVKWYRVTTGHQSSINGWVMSNTVEVTEKQRPFSEKNLMWGDRTLSRGDNQYH